MPFPIHRLRRLRKNPTVRAMVRQNRISVQNLIQPLFAVSGWGVRQEIDGLPGNYHLSIDKLVEEAREIHDAGIPAVLLFGIPEHKDAMASEAYAQNSIIQKAVSAIKESIPALVVITDVCMCEYTEHGHCGIVENGYLVNDKSLELIRRITLSHANSGADIVAPAAMLDGQIRTMRSVLDENGFTETAIMAYSAKYASKLYDPFFKQGTKSVVTFGDKRTHQMDYGNSDEAMREIAFDIEEGADIVMVKPALFYLDIVYRAKSEFKVPLAVYNVSGEYAILKAASELGRINEEEVRHEIMTAFKRAGADLIITYHAQEMARILNKS